jgi:hypothetical protein
MITGPNLPGVYLGFTKGCFVRTLDTISMYSPGSWQFSNRSVPAARDLISHKLIGNCSPRVISDWCPRKELAEGVAWVRGPPVQESPSSFVGERDWNQTIISRCKDQQASANTPNSKQLWKMDCPKEGLSCDKLIVLWDTCIITEIHDTMIHTYIVYSIHVYTNIHYVHVVSIYLI